MKKYWFKPKADGWGIGLPISWQGWAVLLCLILFIGISAFADGFFSPQVSIE